MAQEIVYRSDYYEYGVYRERDAAILRRTALPFANSHAVLSEGLELVAHLPATAKLGLIVDMRTGPVNNEPWFEASQRPLRIAISRRFATVVILVSTALGEMQAARLQHGDGATHRITRSDIVAWKLASAPGFPNAASSGASADHFTETTRTRTRPLPALGRSR